MAMNWQQYKIGLSFVNLSSTLFIRLGGSAQTQLITLRG